MNNTPSTRREFLGQVGQGTLIATLGGGLASELGLTGATSRQGIKGYPSGTDGSGDAGDPGGRDGLPMAFAGIAI